MTSPENGQPDQSLADYVSVLRRNVWTIVVFTAVVPISAYLISSQQTKVYSSSSTVQLSQRDLGAAITGVPTGEAYTNPDRFVQTQAAIARTPEVAALAIKRAGIRMTPYEFLENSSVSPDSNADLLGFVVENEVPSAATKLATAYAQAFVANKYSVDTTNLSQARKELEARVVELRRQGATNTQIYRDLVGQAQSLRTLELLQTRATVVKYGTLAEQVKPTPARNAILGALLGLILGIGGAFLWNALDKRVRTEEEAERILAIPLLARLPKPGKGGRRSERLAMLDQPTDAYAEAVRRLRTSLELANLDQNAKVIMVTSAAPFEGKSTTIANLGIAFARSGHSVALIDLDLRRPSLARLFEIGGRPGVTEVALGKVALEDALVPIQLPLPLTMPGSPTERGKTAPAAGLRVLPCGAIPSDPGEFVGAIVIGQMIERLRRDHDFVLVDAPPLLAVGDAMTLSTRVDAVFAVVALGIANRPTLNELARGLEASPAQKLGFVATGVKERATYGAAAYHYDSKSHKDEVSVPLRRATSSGR